MALPFHSSVGLSERENISRTWTDDVCLVCGVVGYPEQLVSCVKCNSAKEHRYCMKVFPPSTEVELSWICQECLHVRDTRVVGRLDVPIGAIVPLKKRFVRLRKEALSKLGNVNSNLANVEDCGMKESHQEVVDKHLFPGGMPVMNDWEYHDDHNFNVISRGVDFARESGRLKEKKIKQKRKIVLSDSSDDEMTMNVHPASGHSNHENVVESEGSFRIWLDDASKDMVASISCDDFTFDTKKVTREGTSREDVNEVAKLLTNNAPVSVYEHVRERNSLDTQLGDHDSCHISRDKALGDDVDRGVLEIGNDFQMVAGEDIDRGVQYHCDVRSKPMNVPVLPPIWSGRFAFGISNFGVIDAYLSNDASSKVRNEARKLVGVLCVEEVPNSKVWPPRFYTSSSPNDNDIGLYFYTESTSSSWFDELVYELWEKDVTYRVILDCSELLIFPSVLLPNNYQKLQGRYYMWGSFRERQIDQLEPTNRSFLHSKCGNGNPHRSVFNSFGLNAGVTGSTHAHLTHYESVTPDGRAGEESNSSKLKPGSLCVNGVVDGRGKNGFDPTASNGGSGYDSDNSILTLFPLQVENMAVVNKLGEHSLLNLELEVGLCYSKIAGKNLPDVSCMHC